MQYELWTESQEEWHHLAQYPAGHSPSLHTYYVNLRELCLMGSHHHHPILHRIALHLVAFCVSFI